MMMCRTLFFAVRSGAVLASGQSGYEKSTLDSVPDPEIS